MSAANHSQIPRPRAIGRRQTRRPGRRENPNVATPGTPKVNLTSSPPRRHNPFLARFAIGLLLAALSPLWLPLFGCVRLGDWYLNRRR